MKIDREDLVKYIETHVILCKEHQGVLFLTPGEGYPTEHRAWSVLDATPQERLEFYHVEILKLFEEYLNVEKI